MKLDRENCLGGHYNNRILTGIRLRNYQIFPTDDLNVFTWSLKDSEYNLDTIRIYFSYAGCSCKNHYADFGDNSWSEFEIPDSAEVGDIVLTHNYAYRDGQNCVIITCLVPSSSESGGVVYGLKTVEALNSEIIINDHVKKLFDNCYDLESVDIRFGELFVNVSDMSGMFEGCKKLSKITIPNWTTSTKLTNLKSMFFNCQLLASINVSNWNTSNVTDMSWMFGQCFALTTLDLSNWDTSNVTTTVDMFYQCHNLTSIDVSNWNTSNVTNMAAMFNGCTSLTTVDTSDWKTTNVTNMTGMFSNCSSLTELDLSNFDVSSVTNMTHMFRECTSLTTLDLSSWNMVDVIHTDSMFKDCTNLHTLILDDCDRTTVSKIINSSDFPTGTINGETRKIHCNNTTGLTRPEGWEFVR